MRSADHRFQVAKRVEPARSPRRAARPRRPVSLAAPRRGPGARARAARRRDWAALRRPGARSRALGLAHAGRLMNGVRLPAEGSAFVTWDPVRKRSPNRPWRRHGTDRLVLVLVRVLRAYRAAHPGAPRVAVGDLSRPRGGDFGRRFGPVGHASHQSGLDADVYYPRRDRRERAPRNVSQVDRRLAQALVDSFVEAGAERVFVGPRVGLRGPPGRRSGRAQPRRPPPRAAAAAVLSRRLTDARDREGVPGTLRTPYLPSAALVPRAPG